jgi:hypothetical protein
MLRAPHVDGFFTENPIQHDLPLEPLRTEATRGGPTPAPSVVYVRGPTTVHCLLCSTMWPLVVVVMVVVVVGWLRSTLILTQPSFSNTHVTSQVLLRCVLELHCSTALACSGCCLRTPLTKRFGENARRCGAFTPRYVAPGMLLSTSPPPPPTHTHTHTNTQALPRSVQASTSALLSLTHVHSRNQVMLDLTDTSTGQTTKVPATLDTATGQWRAKLTPHEAGGNFTITAFCTLCGGLNSSTIHSVTFGDVFVCSGQSNMQLAMIHTFDRNVTYERIRSGRYVHYTSLHYTLFSTCTTLHHTVVRKLHCTLVRTLHCTLVRTQHYTAL